MSDARSEGGQFQTIVDSGSWFVERVLTTVESCRRQGRDLLDFIVQAVSARRSGDTPPLLLPAKA